MTFNYLPWQLYVLISTGTAIVISIYIIKEWENWNKSFSIGVLLASISAVVASLIKLINTFNVFLEYLDILKIISITCTSIGIALIMIGCYIKVKYNPKKRKRVLLLVGGIIIILIFMGIIVLINLK